MAYETRLMQQILRANAPDIMKHIAETRPIEVTAEGGMISRDIRVPVTAEEKVLFDEGLNGFVFQIKVNSKPSPISHRAIADARHIDFSRCRDMAELNDAYQKAAGYIEFFMQKMQQDFLSWLSEERAKESKKLRNT